MRVAEELRRRRRRLIKDVGSKTLWALEDALAARSPLGEGPFYDPEDFPWSATLRAHWREMRAEAEGVLRWIDALPNFQDISKDQRSITKDDRWKTFFLYGFGYRSEPNCAMCPRTAELVAAIPGVKTAFLSILRPGKHIPEHRGLYRGLVRHHLALIVPEPRERCGIVVDGVEAHWTEGESLFFDDTRRHHAWNDTDGVRVVLFMDAVRPLPWPLDVANEGLLRAIAASPYVQDARQNQMRWEERFARRLA